MLYSDFAASGGVIPMPNTSELHGIEIIAAIVTPDPPPLPKLYAPFTQVDMVPPVWTPPPTKLVTIAIIGPDWPTPVPKCLNNIPLLPLTVGGDLVLLDSVPPDFTPPPTQQFNLVSEGMRNFNDGNIITQDPPPLPPKLAVTQAIQIAAGSVSQDPPPLPPK